MNENLIKLRSLRDDEKALKKVINTTKDAAIPEAFAHVPNGGTFEIEGVGLSATSNTTGAASPSEIPPRIPPERLLLSLTLPSS